MNTLLDETESYRGVLKRISSGQMTAKDIFADYQRENEIAKKDSNRPYSFGVWPLPIL
jgi:hypothetical protein